MFPMAKKRPGGLGSAFAADVRARMEELGISQRDLAERLDTSQSYVNTVLRGHVSPSLDVVERWCKALGCEPKLLLDK